MRFSHSYDKINRLTRAQIDVHPGTVADPYTYDSQYGYDTNGNLAADYNKGIAWVQYNAVDRPDKIQMVNGDKTTYIYDAPGNKRRAKYAVALNGMQIPLGTTGTENTTNIRSTTTRDYAGRFYRFFQIIE